VLSLLIFGSSTLQDFAFAMLIGIASGTYSSIFIASPVLTAWKEREPGFIRRRQRIAEVEGGLVPAYADSVQVAKLADDDETEAEIAADIEAEAPAYEAVPPKGIEAAEPEPESASEAQSAPEVQEKAPARAARTENGDSANPESVERRKRNDERREKRAQRRKGRRR
jgi:SecD/SecF fusion protein